MYLGNYFEQPVVHFSPIHLPSNIFGFYGRNIYCCVQLRSFLKYSRNFMLHFLSFHNEKLQTKNIYGHFFSCQVYKFSKLNFVNEFKKKKMRPLLLLPNLFQHIFLFYLYDLLLLTVVIILCFRQFFFFSFKRELFF